MGNKNLDALLQPLVEQLGYEFVGIEHSSNPKNSVLRLYIDQPQGIDLDDCSRVSREVAALLDVEDPISGHYNLEVSSPGLDRPLFTAAHYERFVGAEIQLMVFAPLDGRRKFRGRIAGQREGQVVLEVDGAEISLELSNVVKAKLVPDYAAVMAEREKAAAQKDNESSRRGSGSK